MTTLTRWLMGKWGEICVHLCRQCRPFFFTSWWWWFPSLLSRRSLSPSLRTHGSHPTILLLPLPVWPSMALDAVFILWWKTSQQGHRLGTWKHTARCCCCLRSWSPKTRFPGTASAHTARAAGAPKGTGVTEDCQVQQFTKGYICSKTWTNMFQEIVSVQGRYLVWWPRIRNVLI